MELDIIRKELFWNIIYLISKKCLDIEGFVYSHISVPLLMDNEFKIP